MADTEADIFDTVGLCTTILFRPPRESTLRKFGAIVEAIVGTGADKESTEGMCTKFTADAVGDKGCRAGWGWWSWG